MLLGRCLALSALEVVVVEVERYRIRIDWEVLLLIASLWMIHTLPVIVNLRARTTTFGRGMPLGA